MRLHWSFAASYSVFVVQCAALEQMFSSSSALDSDSNVEFDSNEATSSENLAPTRPEQSQNLDAELGDCCGYYVLDIVYFVLGLRIATHRDRILASTASPSSVTAGLLGSPDSPDLYSRIAHGSIPNLNLNGIRARLNGPALERDPGSPIMSTTLTSAAELDSFIYRYDQSSCLLHKLNPDSPAPQGRRFLCKILRVREKQQKNHPMYELYIEEPDGSTTFVLSARKQRGKNAAYLIGATRGSFEKNDTRVKGRLRYDAPCSETSGH